MKDATEFFLFDLKKVESTVVTGENVDNQYFPLFSQRPFIRVIKTLYCTVHG